jgi:hypothetical protein
MTAAVDYSSPPPACVMLLGLTCLDLDALLQTPPEQLLQGARSRLQPLPSPRALADDLADAIRWIARHPAAGSPADHSGHHRSPQVGALLDYAHRLEMLQRPPTSG